MSHKKWLVFVSLFIVLNFIILGLINYIVDPFKVFNSNILPYQAQMNERYVKIEYLKKNHQKFNAYLFGSSRIGITKPKVIEKYIPNSKFYNFTLSRANLYDYERYLKFFLKNKYEINTLYLQIDLDDMLDYGQNELNYAYRAHPDLTNESMLLHHIKYLIGFFPLHLNEKISDNINNEKNKRYQFDEGTWSLEKNEQALSENCEEYVANIKNFHIKYRRVERYITKTKSMKSLKNIIDLCKTNHIKLYIFTTPLNHNRLDTFILEDYKKFIKDISKLTDFYNFATYNTITNNDCNYYEDSHYRPQVGKFIAARIFNDKNITLPTDFGEFIKKGSLD